MAFRQAEISLRASGPRLNEIDREQQQRCSAAWSAEQEAMSVSLKQCSSFNAAGRATAEKTADEEYQQKQDCLKQKHQEIRSNPASRREHMIQLFIEAALEQDFPAESLPQHVSLAESSAHASVVGVRSMSSASAFSQLICLCYGFRLADKAWILSGGRQGLSACFHHAPAKCKLFIMISFDFQQQYPGAAAVIEKSAVSVGSRWTILHTEG